MSSGPGAATITNENCIPTAVRDAYDPYALAHSTAQAFTRAGGSSWFFLTADDSLGDELAREATKVVRDDAGTVLGNVKLPADLLQAQTSGAKISGGFRALWDDHMPRAAIPADEACMPLSSSKCPLVAK